MGAGPGLIDAAPTAIAHTVPPRRLSAALAAIAVLAAVAFAALVLLSEPTDGLTTEAGGDALAPAGPGQGRSGDNGLAKGRGFTKPDRGNGGRPVLEVAPTDTTAVDEPRDAATPDPTDPTATEPATATSADDPATTTALSVETAPTASQSATMAGSGTAAPTTAGVTTRAPSETTAGTGAASPTTASPTKASPTTAAPTTAAPTTAAPTTALPTTAAPTSSATTVPATTAPATTAAPTTGSPRLVWEENFDRLDPNRWTIEHSDYGRRNGELQCYRPENVKTTGGRLVLTARKETYDCPRGATARYTSGMIRLHGVQFHPGQALEFRVRLNPADRNRQAGLFPAVWSSSWAEGSWPAGGEVDYLEVMTVEDPRRAMFSMHYQGGSGHELQNKGAYLDGYFSDAWHTVRFEYGHNGRLRWYFDGRLAFSVDHAATVQGYPAPFDEPIDEIKINFALGGRPGPLDDAALGTSGATFEVDYLRIYQM